jgi:hypothetical protein
MEIHLTYKRFAGKAGAILLPEKWITRLFIVLLFRPHFGGGICLQKSVKICPCFES